MKFQQSDLDAYFTRGDPDSDGNCETCDKRIRARRGYFRQTSYEYDEWEGICRKHAVEHLEMIQIISKQTEEIDG